MNFDKLEMIEGEIKKGELMVFFAKPTIGSEKSKFNYKNTPDENGYVKHSGPQYLIPEEREENYE